VVIGRRHDDWLELGVLGLLVWDMLGLLVQDVLGLLVLLRGLRMTEGE
jgi:hypothetical protein